MSQPASCHVAALYVQALWGFQQYTALTAQAQRLLFPEQFIFYTCCLALFQNTKRRGAITAFLGPSRTGGKKCPTVVLLLGDMTEAQQWLLLGRLLAFTSIHWLACMDPLCSAHELSSFSVCCQGSSFHLQNAPRVDDVCGLLTPQDQS